MKLVLTRAALDDLWSIRTDPTRCRPREELFPGCRVTAEGRNVIVFRALDERLEIVRVLHVAVDFKRPVPSGDDLG